MARSRKVFSFVDLILIAIFTTLICLVAPWSFSSTGFYVSTDYLDLVNFPFTAATAILCFTAAVLGFKRSFICVVIYLVLGALGLPVFAGYTGGYELFTGTHLGFLSGYLALAAVTGLIVDRNKRNAYMYFVGMLAGVVTCLVLGSLWMLIVPGISLTGAFAAGFMPFIFTECTKIFIAGMLAYPLRAILLKKIL